MSQHLILQPLQGKEKQPESITKTSALSCSLGTAREGESPHGFNPSTNKIRG